MQSLQTEIESIFAGMGLKPVIAYSVSTGWSAFFGDNEVFLGVTAQKAKKRAVRICSMWKALKGGNNGS